MARRTTGAIARLIDHDYAPATTLGLGASVALIWSAVSGTGYQRAMSWWPAALSVHAVQSWREFVGTGLMTVFFFGIGLEVARERHHGSLHDLRHALAPVLAAMGGMTGPAIIVTVWGHLAHVEPLVHGWGVPMATDIAFSLAILSLAGPHTTTGLRPFLLTLAITDDVLSIVILAGTGIGQIDVWALVVTAALATGVALRSRWFLPTPLRILIVLVLWTSLAISGIEPPLAGVIAALVIPFEPHRSVHLERTVTRISTTLVLPLFALSYCGVDWSGINARIPLLIISAMVVARLFGKSLGIGAGVALSHRLGARVPPLVSGRRLAGAAVLCAIGLTVPLLFAGRLYEPSSATYGAFDVGLVGGSLVAALVGVVLLRSSDTSTPEEAR